MSRRGFTLIELMIVTVLLGILAMIAVPVYQSVRRDAAQGALRSQLRTLAQAQEMHYAEHDVYTDAVDDLDYRPADDLVLEFRTASGGGGGSPPGGGSADGWTARLADPDFGVRCAVFHGGASPFEPAAVEDEIACDEGG